MDKESYLISTLRSSHIGDDGAVIGESVYSADIFCEDIHFKREWMSMAQIGRKAMIVNISDAIAMNARPQFALVSLVLPKDIAKSEIDELIASLEESAREYGCEIVGGDTVGGEKLTIAITIISFSREPLLRKGLREGDLLAYTGVLGGSKRDLERLFAGEPIEEDSRFIIPKLRKDFIYRSSHYLRCGMDISDGLFCDTNKMLEYNDMGYEELIPVPDEIGLSGEEYEMLIGFDPEMLPLIMQIARETDTPLSIFAKAAENSNRYLCHSHHFKDEM